MELYSEGEVVVLPLFFSFSPMHVLMCYRSLTILSVPASATADLLDRIFVQLSFLTPSHVFLNCGKDHSLYVKVKAHANGICGYQEFDVAQAIVKHVSLRLLCVRWEGAINDGTVIRILPSSLPFIKTLVNSVFDLEHGLPTKRHDAVAWLEVGELSDSFMFNV